MLLGPGLGRRGKLREDQLLELGGGAEAVFAGDYVERLADSGFLAGDDALRHRGGYELKDTQADSRGDDIGIDNFRDSLVAAGVDGAHALDRDIVAVVV